MAKKKTTKKKTTKKKRCNVGCIKKANVRVCKRKKKSTAKSRPKKRAKTTPKKSLTSKQEAALDMAGYRKAKKAYKAKNRYKIPRALKTRKNAPSYGLAALGF